MKLRILAAAAFIFSLLLFFIPSFPVKLINTVLIAGCAVLAVFQRNGAGRETEAAPAEASGVGLYDPDELAERLGDVQEDKDRLEKEAREQEGQVRRIHRTYSEFSEGIPYLKNMADIVIRESEKSTVLVTESIFSIGNTSRAVGTNIRAMLEGMFSGEKSLKVHTERLTEDIRKIEELISDFRKVGEGFSRDMEGIEKSVGKIDAFTEDITDLADQTNILAINASIEAARVGDQGKGFAVIAGEVQRLAARSKDLAESINDLIGSIIKTVGNSRKTQTEKVRNAIESIAEYQKFSKNMIEVLSSQLENVGQGVEQTQDLSETVTRNLNDVISSLQFQDKTRQVLEHLIAILEDLDADAAAVFRGLSCVPSGASEGSREDLLARASRHFTVREEWEAFGLEVDEEYSGEDSDSGVKNGLEGDITLF